jgi:hypothetical protein
MKANKEMNWILVAVWTLATAITWAVGSNHIPLVLGSVPTEMAALGLIVLWLIVLVIGGLAGLLLGAAQWQIIRLWGNPHLSWPWVVATAIGLGVGWTIGSYLALWTIQAIDFDPREQLFYGLPVVRPNPLELVLRAAVVGAVVGLIIGVAQWLALRRTVPNAGIWIQVSVVAWLVGVVLYHIAYISSGGPLLAPSWDPGISDDAYIAARRLSNVLGWLAGGLAVGLITALSMRHILATPHSSTQQPNHPPPHTANPTL